MDVHNIVQVGEVKWGKKEKKMHMYSAFVMKSHN